MNWVECVDWSDCRIWRFEAASGGDQDGEGDPQHAGAGCRTAYVAAFVFTAALSLCGCAAAGSGVVTEVSAQTAYLELPPGEVHAGDVVAVVDVRCSGKPHFTRRRRRPGSIHCRKFIRGTGTVTETLSDGRAIARFTDATAVREGDTVETIHRYCQRKRSEQRGRL